MKTASLVTALALSLAVTPAAFAADTYFGSVKGGGQLKFSAGKDHLTKFVTLKMPMKCKANKGKAVGGFKSAKIAGNGSIDGRDSGQVKKGDDHVKYKNVLTGHFSKDRSTAKGSLRFRSSGEVGGKKVDCQTKRLSWSAHIRD